MRRFLDLVAASLIALAPAAPAHAQALEKPKITIGVGGKSLFYYLPLTIALQKGYFKSEGLDVEVQDFPGGARALQALLGGSVDVVSGAFEHTITQQAKGQSIEALVLQGKYAGIVLGMSKAKAASYKSPADLKGMKIGVTAPGSSTNMFVNVLLAKAKLPPDSVAIIGVGATAGAVAIMKRGEIDAISNLDPVISQLESDGAIVPVVDTRTAKGMQDVYGSAYAAGCIYVPVDFSKKYPNTAQAIVNAMVHALRFIQQSTPDQIVAAVPTDYYTDRAQYKAALEKNIETYKHDGSIGIDAAQAVYRDLKSFDPQIQTVPVDVAKSFNMTFQQKAAQNYR
ncbi:MAG: transporter substrate-binding domain-containing protein [Betaproteobacteria bacterium]|nr:MAG: transporter substrate-binding domain-containing protein [Betaproteobacteria bacterium]